MRDPNSNGGPRTQTGKEISSRNSTRHGCCSLTTLILPSESKEDFEALKATWNAYYNPESDVEARLVDDLITADWMLQRSVRTLVEIEAQIFAAEPNPLHWTDDQHKALTRFERYRTANQNAFAKCRRVIEDHARQFFQQRRQEEKHKLFKEKHKPEPTWEETIALMRKKAEALGFRTPDQGPEQTEPPFE